AAMISVPAWGESPKLKIDAELKEKEVTLVQTTSGKMTEITINAQVQNISTEELFLSARNCSYLEDWKTDSAFIVAASLTCKKNFAVPFKMKSGDVKTVAVRMTVLPSITPGEIHFKLGYNAQRAISDAKARSFGVEQEAMPGAPFWSKELVLKVKSNAGRPHKEVEVQIQRQDILKEIERPSLNAHSMVPNIIPGTGGKVDGFKMASVSMGSMYAKLGLKEGDIIHMIDDEPIDSPAHALDLHKALSTKDVVKLLVDREGMDVTIIIKISK
ncbi:MAG: hypothetical protein ACXWQE_13775, partial [Bdellovibrionales bacterium]